MRTARLVLSKGVPIAVLVVLAVFAALVARDAATVERTFKRSDLAFEAQPAAERLWRVDTTLPFAREAFGVDDDLLYRRALRAFAVDARRAENPYDFDRPAFRAEAQASLVSVERSELAAPLRSKAVNLLGVLAFNEAVSDPVNGPNLVRGSVQSFQRAVRVDPGNEEAKYNLELLLRILEPQAERLRIRENIPVPRPGRSIAGGGGARRRPGGERRAGPPRPRLLRVARRVIHVRLWPTITRRQSPPSSSPKLPRLALSECGLWLGARDPETERHYWTGHQWAR